MDGVTQKDLARITGFSPRSLRDAEGSGQLERIHDKPITYSLESTNRFFRTMRNEVSQYRKGGSAPSGSEQEGKPLRPSELKDVHLARKYELEVLEKERVLVPREQFRNEVVDGLQVLRGKVQQLPRGVAEKIPNGQKRRVLKILQEEVSTALSEWASDMEAWAEEC